MLFVIPIPTVFDKLLCSYKIYDSSILVYLIIFFFFYIFGTFEFLTLMELNCNCTLSCAFDSVNYFNYSVSKIPKKPVTIKLSIYTDVYGIYILTLTTLTNNNINFTEYFNIFNTF